ncbi:MAG TPA: hypothetical protein PK993_03530 [Clostridia bacterium]|nr:hypothetical protein [Clostridia bacterium]
MRKKIIVVCLLIIFCLAVIFFVKNELEKQIIVNKSMSINIKNSNAGAEIEYNQGIASVTGHIRISGHNNNYSNSIISVYATSDNRIIGDSQNPRQLLQQTNPNRSGEYLLYFNEPGEYDFVIDTPGYLSTSITNVNVIYGKNLRVKNSDEYISPVYGDINSDKEIELMDLVKLSSEFGNVVDGSESKFDCNNDGIINQLDRNIVKINFKKEKNQELANPIIESDFVTYSEAVYKTTTDGISTYHKTLAEATSKAKQQIEKSLEDNPIPSTIELLKSIEDTSVVNIDNVIVLQLNGNTLNRGQETITVNQTGELVLSDGGTLTGTGKTGVTYGTYGIINNNGIVVANDGVNILGTTSNGICVVNQSINSYLQINGATLKAENRVINNTKGNTTVYGTNTLIDSTVTKGYSIWIDDGYYVHNNGTADVVFCSKGNVVVNGGKLRRVGLGYNGTGTLEVNGGTIENTSGEAVYCVGNNSNPNLIKINDGTVISTSGISIFSAAGDIEINGGTIQGKSEGVYSSASSKTVKMSSGTVTAATGVFCGSTTTAKITGGEIFGTTNYGVHLQSPSVISDIGDANNEDSGIGPYIFGENTGIYNSGSFTKTNFYGGEVKSRDLSTNYGYNSGVFNYTFNSPYYTLKPNRENNFRIESLNQYTYSLKKAIDLAGTDDTITVMNNIYDNLDCNINKKLSINMNNKEILRTGAEIIVSSTGDLTLYGTGKIENNKATKYVIRNNGKLAINDVTIAADLNRSANTLIGESATSDITINSGSILKTIYADYGIVKINGGLVKGYNGIIKSTNCQLIIGKSTEPYDLENPIIEGTATSGATAYSILLKSGTDSFTYNGGIIKNKLSNTYNGTANIRAGNTIQTTFNSSDSTYYTRYN